MNSIKIFIDLFKVSKEDKIYNGENEEIKKMEKLGRVSAYLEILVLTVLILAGIFTLCGNNSLHAVQKNLRENYPKEFYEKRVLVPTIVSTTRVKKYKAGYIDTELGKVKSNQKPETDIITIFKDIDGVYQTVDKYNDNRYSNKLIYVTQEFKTFNETEIVIADNQKMVYKSYLNESIKASDLQDKVVSLYIILFGASLLLLMGFIYLVVISVRLNAELRNSHEPSVVLQEEDEGEYKDRPRTKVITIKQQVEVKMESEDKELTEEDKKRDKLSKIYSNEGGIFKGSKG